MNYILYACFAVMIISLIAFLEILMERVSALRQSYEILNQNLRQTHKILKSLAKRPTRFQ